MLKLVRFLKGYWFKTISGPLFKLIEAIFELITPLVVAWVIDTAIPRGQTGDYSGLVIGGIIILGLGVFGLAFSLTAQFFASRASLGFGTNLRHSLYEHVNTFSYTELDKFSTSSLITRLTADINQAQQAVAMFIRLVTRAPFIIIGAIIMAIAIDLKLSLIFLAVALIVGIILFVIMTTSMPKYKKVQSKLDNVSLLTRENLSGARVVRAFGAEQREKTAFFAAADSHSSSAIRVGALSALLNPLSYAVLNIGIIALLFFGGKRVYYGDLTQGEIIALVNYMMQILNAMVVFANLMLIFTKASASAARINDVFETQSSMAPGEGATPDLTAPAVELNGVTFSYNGSPAPSIINANLAIPRGASVGILGGTGSGKTTLVSLITRLYDTCEGEVKVFGQNVKAYAPGQLGELIGVTPQKAVLFAGTIAENVRWGKESATDEEIARALAVSQSAEFVNAFPEGTEKMLTQGGKNLSGGQRQRLTIARALVASPELLILDDSSSALDFATDAKLRAALKALNNETSLTTISVSQRAASVMHCDLIVVMDDGEIVGAGKHSELIDSCEVYREICLSQNKEDELK